MVDADLSTPTLGRGLSDSRAVTGQRAARAVPLFLMACVMSEVWSTFFLLKFVMLPTLLPPAAALTAARGTAVPVARRGRGSGGDCGHGSRDTYDVATCLTLK